jgi:DNA-binding transcriptional ArsR family regulator
VRDGLRELEDQEQVFAALAHASRRHVLAVLRARGGRMTAGEIARRFECAWPTTTRHLKILEAAGLVRAEPSGRERVYRLDSERLRAVAGGWLEAFAAAPAAGVAAGEPAATARFTPSPGSRAGGAAGRRGASRRRR